MIMFIDGRLKVGCYNNVFQISPSLVIFKLKSLLLSLVPTQVNWL